MLMTGRSREAKLKYLDGTFRVIVHGDHVTCAVTGVPIPLERLTYWSVERQEPYADASASFEAERRARPA